MGRGHGGALAAVVALVVGCGQIIYSNGSGGAGGGGAGGSSGNGCTPGTQRSCACPDGTVGIQDCDADGTGFGTCQCLAGTTSSSSTSSSSTSSGSTGGAGGDCAGHIYYAGMYTLAPPIWADLPNAVGLTSLDAGNAQCQALGVGADHVCDLTEVQAANTAKEALFMAIPSGTTAWMQRTTPVYVEGLSGTPCTAAMVGQTNSIAECSSSCFAANAPCGADNDCCSDICTGGTCAAGTPTPCVCALSPPGYGGNCNDWQYNGHIIGDGEYLVFGPEGGVPTEPGVPANPGDPGFHYDNDTIFDPNDPGADNHHSADFSCVGELRAILCCYQSCM
jgi:hypothetical protein